MSGEIAARPFGSASKKVEEAHEKSVGELRNKVAEAKSVALAKLKA